MPRRSGELRRNKNDIFKDVMTGKEKTVGQWMEENKANRAKRLNTTGVYNPSTGERDYAPNFSGRQKSMGKNRRRRY